MALSQFGGRPGSGSGSGTAASKEIGEVFLVPQTYNSADVVDAGETIVSNDYPLLFPKITNGSVSNNFSVREWPLSDGAMTNAKIAASTTHGGVFYAVLYDGSVVSTLDANTWTPRGKLGQPGDASYTYLWNNQVSTGSGSSSLVPYVTMFSIGSRLVVINYNNRYCAGFYTDNNGTTWTPYSNDATINTILTNSITGWSVQGGPGYAIATDIVGKKIYRSTTGIGGWTDVTGSVTIPAATASWGIFIDATVAIFWNTNVMFRSVDNGVTWSQAAFTPTSATPSNIIRYLGNLYISTWVSNVRTVYRSTDNGATFASAGTIAASATSAGTFYVGQDGALGMASMNARSVDGSTWVANTANIATFSGGYWTVQVIATPTGSITSSIAINGGTIRISSDYGVTYSVSNPLNNGKVYGIHAMDSATSPAGVTVIPCTPVLSSTGRSGVPHSSVAQSAACNIAYVGTWANGFTAVTLPASDYWMGVVWNSYTNMFYLTGRDTDAVYTSVDGTTWNVIPLGSLTQSAKATTPRCIGSVMMLIPASQAAVALQMMVTRPDGTTFWTKTPYTKAWHASGGYSENLIQLGQAVFNPLSNSSTNPLFYQDPRYLNLTSASTSVPPLVNLGLTSNSYGATHKNVMVIRAQAAGTIATIITDSLSIATTATNSVTETVTGGNLLAVLSYGNVIYFFTSTKRVRMSTDNGATWGAFVDLTTIPADEALFMGQTYGDGTVVLYGNRGTYIFDATQTDNGGSATKTLNTGWVAPTGLKYVVKAK